MKIQNNQNGEILSVSNVFQSEGQIIYRINGRNWQRPGTRFFNSFPMLSDTGGTTADGWAILELSEPWQIVSGSRSVSPSSPAEPSPVQAAEPAGVAAFAIGDRVTVDGGADVYTVVSVVRGSYIVDGGAAPLIVSDPSRLAAYIEPEPEPVIVGGFSETERAEFESLKDEVLTLRVAVEKMKAAEPKRVEYVTPWSVATVDGLKMKDFDEICAWVMQGENIYLHGPAGCGKSHTAKQIATALGLDFYESMQLQFKHDICGYGDAAGRFIETPFYKAFKNGGLFFFDEMDRSAAEALTVLNTALANKRFDFPVVGNVTAHENFRVIAAGNTLMDGADSEYVAGSVQDASVKDRFQFWAVDYDENLEIALANQDKNIVSFVHDLRNAAKVANIALVVSYRAISIMANPNLNSNKTRVLSAAILKSLGKDEARILFGNLTDKKNAWAVALGEIAG